MFFLSAFKTTAVATIQIFLVGLLGFLLVRRNFLSSEGLNVLSRFIIEITLPIFIFCALIKDFSFSLYPNWWIFPILSLIITALGLAIGYIFIGLDKGISQKRQFLSLVAFQNSGWLPLPLVAALLPEAEARVLFIYIVMFLLGFNLVIWSFGVWLLSERTIYPVRKFVSTSPQSFSIMVKNLLSNGVKNFELGSLFSPPVIATGLSLLFIALGINKWMPAAILKPLKMLGDCTLPLAMIVVGANLGGIAMRGEDNNREILYVVLAKLMVLPLIVFIILFSFPLPYLVKLLVIIQASMPAATNLSIICRHYKVEDRLVTKAIFWTHVASIITIPLVLALFKSVAF